MSTVADTATADPRSREGRASGPAEHSFLTNVLTNTFDQCFDHGPAEHCVSDQCFRPMFLSKVFDPCFDHCF